MNGVAQIVRTQHSKVDLRFILDIAAFDAVRAKELEQTDAALKNKGSEASAHDDPNHVHGDDCGHDGFNTKERSQLSNHLDQVRIWTCRAIRCHWNGCEEYITYSCWLYHPIEHHDSNVDIQHPNHRPKDVRALAPDVALGASNPGPQPINTIAD
jgi:hypothetical protein